MHGSDIVNVGMDAIHQYLRCPVLYCSVDCQCRLATSMFQSVYAVPVLMEEYYIIMYTATIK